MSNSAAFPYTQFLPICRQDCQDRGWEQLDFIIVSGDAYVDHPSFGVALIARLLESHNYKVGILAQPDWKDPEAFTSLGRPRLGFLVSGGNMDSMVLHYTAAKKPRSEDLYSPGKAAGLRPNRSTIVYCAAIRQSYKKVPIIIGGIETSLRRLAHYDYWSDSVRRSILLDSKADLAVYGMGETAIIEAARRLDKASAAGKNPINADLKGIPGTLLKQTPKQDFDFDKNQSIQLPDYTKVCSDKKAYAESFKIQYENTNPFNAKILIESYPSGEAVIQMPPSPPLSARQMDEIYELPYTRQAHPSYPDGIAALDEVQFSLLSSRGCFGACSFCALAFHQGKNIQARSHESLVREAKLLTLLPGFKGYIHDVGGPTANFRIPACEKMQSKGACDHRQCLFPGPCKNLRADHSDYLALLKKIRSIQGVKKVFVRSGIRFDYLMADPKQDFFRELVAHHISGQLKVAPEHVAKNVISLMGKPDLTSYLSFQQRFYEENKAAQKKQYLVPYFISGHPGSRMQDAIELAEFMRDNRINAQQVQDFYPTPGTLSTCMYYTGIDPRTMKKVHVVKEGREKTLQRALLQFKQAQNHSKVREALRLAGREDLIGNKPECLVPHESGSKKRQRIRKS
ncbi:MAG: YgiQ family radical SAM protein [Spirochaetaceae bacterium]|nr:MAG: YgiQ family radical SAM protein [Spirochaetaceae bacterium]